MQLFSKSPAVVFAASSAAASADRRFSPSSFGPICDF